MFARTLQIEGQRLYAGTLDPGLYEIPLGGGRPHFLETSAAVRGAFRRRGPAVCRGGSGYLRGAAVVSRVASRQTQCWPIEILRLCRWITMGSFGSATSIGALTSSMPALTRARHLEDQHLFCVNRIVHGPTTAVATANGLVLFDASGQKRQVLGKDQGVIANHVTDVVFSGEDMIAATPAGLSFIARDGVRSLYAFHGLVNNHAYALGMVNDRLMAGTLGGLSILESGVVQGQLHDVELAFSTQLGDSDRSLGFRCVCRDIWSRGDSTLGRWHVAQLSRRGFTGRNQSGRHGRDAGYTCMRERSVEGS